MGDPQEEKGTTALERAYGLGAAEVAGALGVDAGQGLSDGAVRERAQKYGPNVLQSDTKASFLQMALRQLRDPMNIMLVAVTAASAAIGQLRTAGVVAALVLFNILSGARQEKKAQASVEALEAMQIPKARVLRGGEVMEIPAPDIVPGDVVMVEAGDLVPADGRLVRSATLEIGESALTGEAAPVSKDPATVSGDDVALGDRSDMVFMNTSVTRGTGSFVVTATGMATEMGKIAGMLRSVSRARSPLQKQMGDLTKKLSYVAYGALLLVVILGLVRGQEFGDLILAGVAMAISAIPTGLPTFVQAMLSSGARRLADAKAIVRGLSDVETLGSTSAINTDKTGTLTLNQMTVRKLFYEGDWLTVEGGGYDLNGRIVGVAGVEVPKLDALAYISSLASDATVGDDGAVVGDPTEVALVVLAHKIGIDPGESRRAYPRLAEVPFDSAYKFMATFHRVPWRDEEGDVLVELVKGAPDVIIGRSSRAFWRDGRIVPIEQTRDELLAANRELSAKGLRVLALAARRLSDNQEQATKDDPMSMVEDLVIMGLVGIIDPLRAEARDAVQTALSAGIDVRMITGDHAVTARAIGDELGLGSGVISGPEFQKLSEEELEGRVADLHVFGRVAPEDKLRLVRTLQGQGRVVAMTGDGVNDAPALKQADVGVAMGTGTEVSKQAAAMVLTDDNFATLVHAIELGRDLWNRIVAYIRYQMIQLFGLVSLVVICSIFAINDGVPLTPVQLLFLNFLISVPPVIAIATDAPSRGVMGLPPRDPSLKIFNARTAPRWIAFGLVLGLSALGAFLLAPGEASTTKASVPVTMAFAVMGLGTVFEALSARRDLESAFEAPLLHYAGILAVPALLVVFSVEVAFMQEWLLLTSLTGAQWGIVLGLASIVFWVMELEKLVRRRRAHAGAVVGTAAPRVDIRPSPEQEAG